MCGKIHKVAIFSKQEWINRLNQVIDRIIEIEAEIEKPSIADDALNQEYFKLLNERGQLEHNLGCVALAEINRKHNIEHGVAYAVGEMKPDQSLYVFDVTMTPTEARWWADYLQRSGVFAAVL